LLCHWTLLDDVFNVELIFCAAAATTQSLSQSPSVVVVERK
jgi:hypothetical protein